MHVPILRGGGAGGPDLPLKISKYRFFSNTGPDPLKIVKLPSQLSILGHHRHASETPFKRTKRRRPANSGIWIIPHHQTKKNVVKVGPSLTKLSGSVHVVVTDK